MKILFKTSIIAFIAFFAVSSASAFTFENVKMKAKTSTPILSQKVDVKKYDQTDNQKLESLQHEKKKLESLQAISSSFDAPEVETLGVSNETTNSIQFNGELIDLGDTDQVTTTFLYRERVNPPQIENLLFQIALLTYYSNPSNTSYAEILNADILFDENEFEAVLNDYNPSGDYIMVACGEYLNESGQLQATCGSAVEFIGNSVSNEGELQFSESSNNPHSYIIEVEGDQTSDEFSVLAFELEAEDGDIVVEKLFVRVEILNSIPENSTGAISAQQRFNNVIDNVSISGDDVAVNDNGQSVLFPTFRDLDGDGLTNDIVGHVELDLALDTDEIYLDENEDIELEIIAEFAAAGESDDLNYAAGTQVRFSFTSDNVNRTVAVHSNGDELNQNDLQGTAIGNTHTLLASGIVVTDVDFDTDTFSNNEGETILVQYEIEFEIEAFEDTFFIPTEAVLNDSNIGGVSFNILDENGNSSALVNNGAVNFASFSSNADVENGFYRIDNNGVEDFTLTVSVTSDIAEIGFNRVQVQSLHFSDTPNGNNINILNLTPPYDYRTNLVYLEA